MVGWGARRISFISVHVTHASHTVRRNFVRLQRGGPLRGVGVGSLYTVTYVGGSAFCTRCRSVCTLTGTLRGGLVRSVLTDMPHAGSDITLRRTRALAQRLFRTFVRGRQTIGVLFSNDQRNVFTGDVRGKLHRHFRRTSPAFTTSLGQNVLLSFYIRNYFCTFTGGDDQVSRNGLIRLLKTVTGATRDVRFWRTGGNSNEYQDRFLQYRIV